MITAEKIIHKRQEKSFSCGAAAFAMLFGISEDMARKACKTDSDGTSNVNIFRAIKDTGLNANYVNLNNSYDEMMNDLISLSHHFALYMSGTYRTGAKEGKSRGRDRIRRHAILLADGMAYDGGENRACPIDCYAHTFGKSLIFDCMIIIDEERPNYGKSTKNIE